MPKFVAATATISNPDRQLEVLYQRVPLRFPCPGSDIYRSFFAAPAPAPRGNPARVALEQALPLYEAPERTSPWMRLFVSVMTNDATHTVTAVAILSAFHGIISYVWQALLDPTRRQTVADQLASVQGSDEGAAWRSDAIRTAMQEDRYSQLLALIDLHRIALAYVTNKKGGDQIMDALDAAVRQRHRARHEPLDGFVSRLISGGIDMKEIQEIMEEAQAAESRPSLSATRRANPQHRRDFSDQPWRRCRPLQQHVLRRSTVRHRRIHSGVKPRRTNACWLCHARANAAKPTGPLRGRDA